MTKGTILLTGASGFIGSHIAETLLLGGWKVVCLRRSTSNTWRLSAQPNIIWHDIDLNQDLAPLFVEHSFDAVIHAATAYGKKGEDNSSLLFANVYFPLRLLDLAIKHHVSLFVSTDTFFKTAVHNYSYMQNYTLSKSHFSDWMALAGDAIKLVSLSLFQVYGERDSDTKFITNLLLKLQLGVPAMDFTRGEQKRDFIYVKDVAAAYQSVIDARASIKPGLHLFDVGTGAETELRKFIELAAQLTGSRTCLNFGVIPYLADEIFSSRANVEPFKTAFGWKPEFSLNAGLKRTVDWFAENAHLYASVSGP
ncbi:MAG: NAD(P)-dependent oxidoreductase [Leptospirales bacterium]|nr:NAD(P)-dependent oxidoreductase [Leptospirales bacterium]